MNDSKEGADAWIKLQAPAKVNLMLSVHGRRPDGFHELTSLVAPLDFCDELELRINARETDTLVSDGVEIPLDDSNLVLQAAQRFRQEAGRRECFDFRLRKRIPVGAGLGGGSSDAVAALRGMDILLDTRMNGEKLRGMAATLGSDCPFFVDATPALMRGRGERIESLDPAISRRIAGQRLVLFRPDFGVDTGWAYGQLASAPELYEEPISVEQRLHAFYDGGRLDELFHNVFEVVAGQKFLAIPCLLELLREHGHKCMMSGSGSACFALVDGDEEASEIKEICRKCWGQTMFWVETSLTERKI